MAEKVEIEVLLRPDGTVELVTHGLKGESCLEETKGLEKAVGKVLKREKTREFYEKAKAAVKSTLGRKG